MEQTNRKRKELGLPGGRNDRVPFRFYSKTDWLRLGFRGRHRKLVNHSTASEIRENLDETVWQSYFKFCFERNPFDKAISRYYWSTEEPRPDMSEYLDNCPVESLSNWNIYTINDHVAADFVGRFENLADDLAEIKQRLGLPEISGLPKAKSGYRTNREHYSRVLGPEARKRIELVCAREIQTFDYQWQAED